MTSIAGQIEKFDFNSVSNGVADPVLGNDVQSIFEEAWSTQIGNAPTVAAQIVAGNEHLRATLQAGPLPDLPSDLALPPGAVLTFQYSVEQLLVQPNGYWIIATGDNGRVDDNGDPQANGDVELVSLSINSSSDTWTTTLSGIYHTGHGLPVVPFSVSIEETITVLGTIAASFSLQYTAYPPQTQYDLKNLNAALTALEIFGAGGVSAVLGPLGAPLDGFASGEIQAYLDAKLKPQAMQFTPLASLLKGIPQRLYLPGTVDNLWFHYDTLSFPQGPIAQNSGYNGVVSLQQAGAAIVFSGRIAPTRATIVGFALIAGPSSVVLYSIAGQPAARPVLVQHQYTAWCSDQAVNPTFVWTITGAQGQAAPSVKLAGANQQTVTVSFDDNSVTPSGELILTVHTDDSLHLKDASGHLPSASMVIHVVHETATVPTPGRAPKSIAVPAS